MDGRSKTIAREQKRRPAWGTGGALLLLPLFGGDEKHPSNGVPRAKLRDSRDRLVTIERPAVSASSLVVAKLPAGHPSGQICRSLEESSQRPNRFHGQIYRPSGCLGWRA